MEPKPGKIPRPIGVTVLATLALLIGIFGMLGGATLVFAGNVTILNILAIIFGVLFLPAGIGLLRGNLWLGWGLSLLVSILSILRNIGEAMVTGAIIYAIPGIVIPLVIIGYLMTPKVKAFFSPE